jgi:hypothetical protein
MRQENIVSQGASNNICEPCRQGRHRQCEEGDCACPTRAEDEQIGRIFEANNQGEEGLAETIYSNLLYGGSEVAGILTEGAGKPAVKLFVRQVLRANRAIKC